jgi:hypothetical protein
LAYGAEGILYFCYSGGNVAKVGPWNTDREARAALTFQYPTVKATNARIAFWGPKLLGRKSTKIFSTATWKASDLVEPGKGLIVEYMDSNLLVGLLERPGRKPLAMVVNCHVSKGFRDLPNRRAIVEFGPSVRTVKVLERGADRTVDGHQVTLDLEPGGGQLLELDLAKG